MVQIGGSTGSREAKRRAAEGPTAAQAVQNQKLHRMARICVAPSEATQLERVQWTPWMRQVPKVYQPSVPRVTAEDICQERMLWQHGSQSDSNG